MELNEAGQPRNAVAWRQFVTQSWFCALWWIFFSYQVLQNVATGYPGWAVVWLACLAGLFGWAEQQEKKEKEKAQLREIQRTFAAGLQVPEPVSL